MCRVLVVDDADSNRWIMGRLLRHCGHEAFCADNGESALSRCENQTPDIVLLDLQMPVMDGLTFLKTIRADERWKDLPVIVVTSEESGVSVAEAYRLGAKDCLIKTRFTTDQLLASIQKHIDA